MPTIDPSSQLGSFLRTQISELKKSGSADSGVQEKTNVQLAGQEPTQATARHANSDSFLETLSLLDPKVKQRLLQRIRSLDGDDPQRPRKVFRFFMESVLSQEFAVALSNDVDLDSLVTPVIDQMESDEELSAAIHKAASHLMSAATSGM